MTAQEVKRKLTAILSADVKGYSRLLGKVRMEKKDQRNRAGVKGLS